MTDALSDQWRQSPTATVVPVMDPPDVDAFFTNHYFANRPVVLRGLAASWRAVSRWTPEYFAESFGDRTVEITAGRDADPRFEDNFVAHRTEVAMRDFVKDVMDGTGNDRYLVAKNHVLQRPEFQTLLDDIRCPDGFLDPAGLRESAKLWFGPLGTVTPFHHDACNILFVQIYGSKKVRMVEPHELPRLYNDRECFSPVDLDDIDLDRFPWMTDVPVAEAVVRPGDALLIPLGWWHWVKSLEASISLSFTGFALPGRPSIWRYR
ncbi:cupin-like domain-containing protein [Actinocorallia sp. A-T 12471]|uniref:cupin-like domain-containing protein n=1 Tax=Actinocorallia sp. A-T 12471 TaxID=3089813 RepID=UPI0029D01EE2|nr:cupin-like domain-containing protein [Actinocorallia sp. A-T 12471]MDX6741534.1 cupin-like domain-containing protein [Actinocorallia sp. A-T 12471]